jgi:hypothetical protein
MFWLDRTQTTAEMPNSFSPSEMTFGIWVPLRCPCDTHDVRHRPHSDEHTEIPDSLFPSENDFQMTFRISVPVGFVPATQRMSSLDCTRTKAETLDSVLLRVMTFEIWVPVGYVPATRKIEYRLDMSLRHEKFLYQSYADGHGEAKFRAPWQKCPSEFQYRFRKKNINIK